jgi:hypothetical protein
MANVRYSKAEAFGTSQRVGFIKIERAFFASVALLSFNVVLADTVSSFPVTGVV